MSDQTSEQESPVEDPGKTWYVYENVQGLNVFRGKVLTLASTTAQPANSTQWKPPVPATGQAVYWDGYGWRTAVDVTSLAIDDLKSLAIASSGRRLSSSIQGLATSYSVEERNTWAQQQAEAQAWTADNSAATPLLTALSAARNVPVADLVKKILAKNQSYSAAYNAALGQHQKERDLIEKATLPSDLVAFANEDLIHGILR